MKSELNVLLRLSAPMIATQFFIMGMGFVDTAMSGQYSSLDLAGVAMGGVILWPLFMLFAGVLTALTPMVSQHVGGGRRLAVGALIQQGIWVAMIFGVILFLLVRISEPLLILFDVAPEAVSIAARIAPVPGQWPSGIGMVGSRPVAPNGTPVAAAIEAARSSP